MGTYPGISSEAFRHPLDRQAEEALRRVPGFDLVAKKFVEYAYERPQLLYLTASAIKASGRQYATIYGIFRECVRDLDFSPEPVLFIVQNPQINAYSMGEENPYIVINTGLLDLLTEAEIRVVIAHELGHLKCGHSTLIQMALWASNVASIIGEMTFGLGNFVSTGLLIAFYEWRRKAELSADRASLLVVEDLLTVLTTMMKLAGGSQKFGNECHLDEFIKQSQEYRQMDDDSLNQIYKVLMYTGATGTMLSHPFPVERVSYLQEWANDREYADIRRGKYPRRSVEVNTATGSRESEVDRLRRQIEDLQREIDRRQS
jgi:Zn-dependent protease with chaperone function